MLFLVFCVGIEMLEAFEVDVILFSPPFLLSVLVRRFARYTIEKHYLVQKTG